MHIYLVSNYYHFLDLWQHPIGKLDTNAGLSTLAVLKDSL